MATLELYLVRHGLAAERSEWDPENLAEQPLDIARVKALFSD